MFSVVRSTHHDECILISSRFAEKSIAITPIYLALLRKAFKKTGYFMTSGKKVGR